MKAASASAQMNDSGHFVFSSEQLRQSVTEAHITIRALLRDLCGVDMEIADSFRAVLDADVGRYLTLVRALPRLRSVRQLVHTPELSRFLHAELGYQCPMEPSEPVVHIQGDHLRIPGGYFGTKPHQDATAFGDVPRLMTIWIPIVDVAEDTFPLELAVGRHREGIFRNVPANQVYEIQADALENEAFIPIPAPAGSAILFDGFMPHRSGPGKVGAFRLAFSYRVVEASDARFFADGFKHANPGAKKA